MTQTLERQELASLHSAKAQAALARGDTLAARDLSADAASIFEAEIRLAQDEEAEHLLRFLAATQYYRGGLYREARRLVDHIDSDKLPTSTRHLLPDFVQDVVARSASDYPDRIRNEVTRLLAVKSYPAVLALLAEHPFVHTPGDLAFLRARCCESLGNMRAAVRFIRKAAEFAPDDPDIHAALEAYSAQTPSDEQRD